MTRMPKPTNVMTAQEFAAFLRRNFGRTCFVRILNPDDARFLQIEVGSLEQITDAAKEKAK